MILRWLTDGQKTPPPYKLSQVTVPTALYVLRGCAPLLLCVLPCLGVQTTHVRAACSHGSVVLWSPFTRDDALQVCRNA